jgi:catechol 2,3-dioxygenase-like lactoylglutathione lyase family enzyme
MGASRVNHVSISGTDLEDSVEFYGRLLGAVPIATPDFPAPVRWLALGDTQLHIFESDLEPTSQHHFGVEVDLDVLVAAYRLAAERGILESEAFGGHLIGLPGDVVQLYLRDPSGNLVELDAEGASRLPEDLRDELRVLDEGRPQHGTHADARLYIGAERRR